MAQSQQFLDDFQQKMNRLTDIRRKLQYSVEFKQQFTNELKTRLGEVNDKVKQLAGLINDLKTKADELEKQIGTNTTSISDRERQMGEINQQMANITAEKDRITQEFNEHKNRTQTQVKEQQDKIDQLEAQLRQLIEELRLTNEKKESAENNLKALQNDIQASGDEKDRTHSQALAQLAEESRQQLEQQQRELTQRINEADTKIRELEQQLQEKTAQHEQLQKQLSENQNQSQGQVADLQKQIDNLTQENQQLIQRLMSASQSINEANDELESIVNSVPNAETKQAVDALLNEITAQLQQSIENISRATQGQIVPPGQQYDIETNFNNLIAIHADNHQTGQYTSFIRKLKGDLQNSINQLIRSAENGDKNSQEQLKQILQENKLIVPSQRAGKRYKRKTTKKNKKLKGGFTYKLGVKRRIITLNSSRRTSRNSSRRTSRNSSRRTFK